MADRKPRRTRGDGAFFQRADGKWVGRVELPPRGGKRRYKTVSSVDRNICIDKLKKLRADVDAGRIATSSSTTVEKWMTHWLDNIHSKRKIRPGVLDDYRGVIRNHIVPALGAKRIDKLTPQHVRDMHTAIGPRRTAELAHVILQKALTDAVRDGITTRNVAELVDKPVYMKNPRKGLPKPMAKHVVSTAFAAADESTAVRIAAGFMTGARRGELLGLRWDYVDLDTGRIEFAWQLQSLTQSHGCDPQGDAWSCGRVKAAYCPQRHWEFPPGFEHEVCEKSLVFTRPKTDAGFRVIHAMPPLLTALRKLHAEQGRNPHRLVWHREGRAIDPRDDYDMWRSVFRAAGLIGPDESLPPHIARNTAATLLRDAGVDEQTRMELLGHASVDAHRGYAGASRELHVAALNSLAEIMPVSSL